VVEQGEMVPLCGLSLFENLVTLSAFFPFLLLGDLPEIVQKFLPPPVCPARLRGVFLSLEFFPPSHHSFHDVRSDQVVFR